MRRRRRLDRDGPVFVIRADDKAAPATIRAYVQAALAAGATSFALPLRLEQLARHVEAWQAANPDRVRVPG